MWTQVEENGQVHGRNIFHYLVNIWMLPLFIGSWEPEGVANWITEHSELEQTHWDWTHCHCIISTMLWPTELTSVSEWTSGDIVIHQLAFECLLHQDILHCSSQRWSWINRLSFLKVCSFSKLQMRYSRSSDSTVVICHLCNTKDGIYKCLLYFNT